MLIGYARVSTRDQTLDSQRAALEAAGCERVYGEIISGRVWARVELDRALDGLREADIFVVWKIDRLGRSVSEMVSTIAAIHARGAFLRSLTDGIDTSTAAGTMVAHILSVIADFERELIVERTHAGLANARRHGRVGGRPRALNLSQREAVREMSNNGKSISEIARTFSVSRATIHRTISAL